MWHKATSTDNMSMPHTVSSHRRSPGCESPGKTIRAQSNDEPIMHACIIIRHTATRAPLPSLGAIASRDNPSQHI